MCARVCGRVYACVCVMSVGRRESSCGVLQWLEPLLHTARSWVRVPPEKVYTSSLVGSHSLPSTISPPLLA